LLLNTAKAMDDKPVALRLKELETLERISERIGKISASVVWTRYSEAS